MSGSGAVGTFARHEVRSRWRTITVLGVVAGLFGGLTLAVVSLFLRSDSVYDRLVERTGLADARVGTYNVFNRVRDSDRVRVDLAAARAAVVARPDVVDLQQLVAVYVNPLATASTYYAVWAPTTQWHGIDQPVVVSGRLPATDAVGEVMINEQRAAQDHVRIGDRVAVGVFAATQVRGSDEGLDYPEAGTATLRVVGVFRSPDSGTGFNRYIAGPAFAQRYASRAGIGSLQLLRLDDTPAPPLAAQVDRLNDRLTDRYGAGFYSYVDLATPRQTPDPVVPPTLAVLRAGILGFVVVVGAVGLLILGQVARRLDELSRADVASADALGLSRRRQLASRTLALAPAAVLAAVLAGAGAVLGGLLEPPGALAGFEPAPGWLGHPVVIVAGSIGTAVVVLGLAVALAALDGAARTVAIEQRRRGVARRVRFGPVAGLALALGRGHGSRATTMRVRSTIVSTAAILAALAAVVVLVDELGSIEDSRARWGWTPDFSVSGDSPQTRALLAGDQRVTAADSVVDAPLVVRHGGDKVTLTGYGREHIKGELPYETAAGERPAGRGQIGLGPSAAEQLRVQVGDRVDLVAADGRTQRVRVSGIVVLPTVENEPLGRNALVPLPVLREFALSRGYENIFVRTTGPDAAAQVRARLKPTIGTLSPVAPPTVRALDRLVGPGRVLVAVLGLSVVLLVAGHARQLVRRRGGQLAIAEAVGMAPRQVVAAAAGSVAAVTAAATLVGLPVGWAAGRVLVAELAPRLGLGTRGSPSTELLVGVVVLVGAAGVAGCAGSAGSALARRGDRWGRGSVFAVRAPEGPR